MNQVPYETLWMPSNVMGPEKTFGTPVDIARGLYRLTAITVFGEEASKGDIVRCEPNARGRLVICEVVERSDHATLAFLLRLNEVSSEPNPELVKARQRRLLELVEASFGGDGGAEGGMGVLGLWVPADRIDELIELAATEAIEAGDLNPFHDDDASRVGLWQYFVISHPEWEAPAEVPGWQELMDEPPPDVIAVDWDPSSDPVASAWPQTIVDNLLDGARTDRTRADLLQSRRYLPLLIIEARAAAFHRWGFERVGPQNFPLFPEGFDVAKWEVAHDPNQDVRYSADDEVNEFMRACIQGLGVDPDADPRDPVT